jgi:hypothetical protein
MQLSTNNISLFTSNKHSNFKINKKMSSRNSLKHHLHCKQMALTNVHHSIAPHPVTIITSVDILKLLGKKLP